jgi:glycosyltransferase involved in cell wall biosynthesis
MRIFYLAFVETDISNACVIHTREIVENLSALGHDVTVVLPRPLKKQIWENVDHKWVRFWGFGLPRKYIFFLESVSRIFWMHRRQPYDLLYLRETEHTPLLLPFLRLMKLPLFVEVNGWLLDDLHLKGATAGRISSAKTHQQLLFQTATGILVSTSGNADRLASHYGIEKSRIHVQELGCNTILFKPGNQEKARTFLDLPSRAKLILFAGSFHHHHDLKILLESFSLVLKQYPETYLILLGTGAQFKAIQRKVEELRLNSHVMLPGVRPYEEMSIWYRAVDIAVLPLTAKKIEQQNGCLSLKLWEYMASGLPVIATDFTHTPSAKLLDDKVLVVPPEETVTMTTAILSLLKDPSLCRQLSAAARSYVLEHRSWRHAAKETIDFILLRLQGE